MNYLIRKATVHDYEMVNLLSYELYRLHFKNRLDVFNDTQVCFSRENFIQEINNPHTNILLLEYEDQIIAYTCFQLIQKEKTLLKCRKNYLSIDDFVVSKNYHNKGFGHALHDEIVKYALKEHSTHIELDVYEFNQDAYRFYKKLGFETKVRTMEYRL